MFLCNYEDWMNRANSKLCLQSASRELRFRLIIKRYMIFLNGRNESIDLINADLDLSISSTHSRARLGTQVSFRQNHKQQRNSNRSWFWCISEFLALARKQAAQFYLVLRTQARIFDLGTPRWGGGWKATTWSREASDVWSTRA